MRIPKRTALAVSGLAFAGATALTLGAPASAGAQTVSNTPRQAAAAPAWFGCGGWDWCFDDCDWDCWW